MRVKILFEPVPAIISLPVHYNHIVQGFIYRNLSRALATEVHDQGYQFEKRRFRFFTFSRLIGTNRIHPDDRTVRQFRGVLTLWVASPLTKILESFVSHLARAGQVMLGENELRVAAVEVPFEQFKSEDNRELAEAGEGSESTAQQAVKIQIATLSPITVYSTLLTKDGRKKTYYYSPQEPDFSRLIAANLVKKYLALRALPAGNHGYSQVPVSTNGITIQPLLVSAHNQHITRYRDTTIKAWSGIYELTGTPELIRLAFDCGLGSKNSQGFGMIERWNERRKE